MTAHFRTRGPSVDSAASFEWSRRMRCTPLAFALSLSLAIGSVSAAEPAKPAKVPSMQEILDASPASDWRTLDPDHTLYLQLPTGRVVIELATAFAPNHVANISTLATEK